MTGAPLDHSTPADEGQAGSADEQPRLPGGQPGPPGSGTFSLDNRPTPALYLAAWVLSGLGVAMLFVAGLAQAPGQGLLLVGGLALLLIGLIAAAGYQLVVRRSRSAQAYQGPSPLILFGIFFALVNLASIPLVIAGLEGVNEPGPFLLGVALQTVAYLLPIWLFVIRAGALSWREMGVPGRGDAGRLVGDAAFAVGVMLPVTLLALIGGALVSQLLRVRPPTVVPEPSNPAEMVAVMLAAAILAPIGEEIFFRGVALTAWLRDLGPRSALLRSSLFFGLIHILNVRSTTFDEGVRQAAVILSVILPLGFVLGWLYLRRGLVAPIVAHITYNGILVVLLIIATQLGPVINQ